MAALEQLNGLNIGTVERKEIVCRERRLLFVDQKNFPRTGLQEIWKFQLTFLSKGQQGPIPHPNLVHFGRNPPQSCRFFLQTDQQKSRLKKMHHKAWLGWPSSPLPCFLPEICGYGMGSQGTQHWCLSCQKPQWDQRDLRRVKKKNVHTNTHGSIICNCLLLQRGPEPLSDFKTF